MPNIAEPLIKPRIAALRADAAEPVQALMESFALNLRGRGVAVAGLVQIRHCDPKTGRARVALRDLESGALFEISQDLGPGSVACNLDAGELAQACAIVEDAARRGVDLIVLSKFAKQEAERGGLCDAFRCAIAAKTPIVASVSQHFLSEWAAFAGRLAEFVEPSEESLHAWWDGLKRERPLRETA